MGTLTIKGPDRALDGEPAQIIYLVELTLLYGSIVLGNQAKERIGNYGTCMLNAFLVWEYIVCQQFFSTTISVSC